MAERFFRIEHLWAWVSFDDEGEGLCGAKIGDTWLPMIAADKDRLLSLRPVVMKIAQETKKEIRLVKFTAREDLDVIG